MNIDNRLNFATCSLDMNYAPEEVDRAVELLLSVKGPISAKHGCRLCTVEIEATAPGSIHYREEWDTEEALHLNIRSEEFRQVLVAMDLCREEPQIVVGKLSGHCGMEYLRILRNTDNPVELAAQQRRMNHGRAKD